MTDYRFKAGVQYEAEGHTITFVKDMTEGDLVSEEVVAELDGKPVHNGQKIPRAIAVFLGLQND